MSLALATYGVASIYWKTPGTALAFGMSVLLAGATAFGWSIHLRKVRRAARDFDGVTYLIFGGCRWEATKEPYEGEKIRQGFVRVYPGSIEIRTGGEAKLSARYETAQLVSAVRLRVMWGLMDPVVRLRFADGMGYDITLDHAGPRGILPLRRRHAEAFIANVRAALEPLPSAA
jgi:hypothetical protein